MLGISSAPGEKSQLSSCYLIHDIEHKHSPALGPGSRCSVFLTSIGSMWSTSSAPGRGVGCHTSNACYPIHNDSHIYSLAEGVESRFPVFLHGWEAKTLLMTLGTIVVMKSDVLSGGGCVVVGLTVSQGWHKDDIRALITLTDSMRCTQNVRWLVQIYCAFQFLSDVTSIVTLSNSTPWLGFSPAP